jgi:hypothetical protein
MWITSSPGLIESWNVCGAAAKMCAKWETTVQRESGWRQLWQPHFSRSDPSSISQHIHEYDCAKSNLIVPGLAPLHETATYAQQ